MIKTIIKTLIILILTIILLLLFAFIFKNQFEEIVPKEKRSSNRGLYITEYVAQLPVRFKSIREQAKKCGLDTLVIDAKRTLSKPLLTLLKEHKLNPETKVSAEAWLSELTQKLHKEGFIVTVRLVVFKDDHLALARPDLAVAVKGGEFYRDNKGGKWGDPYSEEVRLYNELIAERAALSGVDEIQFDYIRFPAEGEAKHAYYPFEKEGITKVEVINSFLEAVCKRVEKYKVSIAVDIFGVTAWQSENDIKNLGQDLKKIAQYIDVLSPMFYPSHFHRGYEGFANPGSHPYYFVNTGIKKAKEILSGEAVAIVPWIQGFNLRSPNFGPNYILDQIHAAKDATLEGFLIWNARNIYDVAFEGLGR